jgi:hypothetical protein
MKHLDIEKAEIFTAPENGGKYLRVIYWYNGPEAQPLRHTSYLRVGNPNAAKHIVELLNHTALDRQADLRGQ